MRHIFLALCFLLTIPAHAQDTLGTYRTTYSPESRVIRIIGMGKGREVPAPTATVYALAISVDPQDCAPRHLYRGCFVVHKQELPELVKALRIARTKLLYWNKIAAANRIDSVYKEMDDYTSIVGELSFVYSKVGNRAEILMYNGPRPVMFNKRDRKPTGITISFATAEEITEFINLINPVVVAKHFKKVSTGTDAPPSGF